MTTDLDIRNEYKAFKGLPLPGWAIRFAKEGEWEVGAQLRTKDGRRTGNSFIFRKSVRGFHTVTDAGNCVIYQAAELEEGFYYPLWILTASPSGVKRYVE